MKLVEPKNLATPAHFISNLKVTLRRKTCPRTNEKCPNCQEMLPRQTKITEGKSGTPPRATSQSVPRESTSAMGQPWEHGGGAIQGETDTSALDAHN